MLNEVWMLCASYASCYRYFCFMLYVNILCAVYICGYGCSQL